MDQELQFRFDQITKYDTHYSTARTAAVTLLFTVAVLVSANVVIKPDVWVSSFGLATVAIVLTFATLLSMHFQQLTDACAMAHDDLANLAKSKGENKSDAQRKISSDYINPRDLISAHCSGENGFRHAEKGLTRGFNAYVCIGSIIFFILNVLLFSVVNG